MKTKTDLKRVMTVMDLGVFTTENNFENNFLKVKKLPVVFHIIFLKVVFQNLPQLQNSKNYVQWAATTGARAFKNYDKGTK